MLVSLTVGKVDAGVAVLLTEDKRLIEFPSILLPPDISSGSIVDVNVSRNFNAEDRSIKAFSKLQSQLLSEFGTSSPSAPVLRCRNATQTSVVLEWDPIALASASLRSLSLYRNGNKAGAIPRPLEMTSTKISGLAVDTEYTFNLVLKTTAGAYSSEKLTVKTHKMTNLTGITVTTGLIDPAARSELSATVTRIGAKLLEQVRIDTTHFVCTEPRGPAWERARDMNIPIVLPEWVGACEREGRIAGVRGYYLDADPKLRQGSTAVNPAQANPSSLNLPERNRQDSMAISPMQQQNPHHPPASQGAARSMAIPATQITPPTPETSSEEFKSSTRSQQAAATPETVQEQPEAESAQGDEDDGEVGDFEQNAYAPISANGGVTEQEVDGDDGEDEKPEVKEEPQTNEEPETKEEPERGTSFMPGGASSAAQHAEDIPKTADSITEAGPTDAEAEAEEAGKDFDEVKL